MAVTATSILYSAAAVRRILGLSQSAKVKIQVWSKVVWVWAKGSRPTLISKEVFKRHFVEWRKAQALGLQVSYPTGNHYEVRNEEKETSYWVETRPDGIFCTCDDCNNQLQFWGKACCKHGYAVLAHIGYESLSAYLMAQKVVPMPRRASEPAARYSA